MTTEPITEVARVERDDVVHELNRVRLLIEEHFPGLWPAVDAGLAVCATLLLKDNSNPVALIYVGGPSSSKTTVADMFADAAVEVTGMDEAGQGEEHPLIYVSDSFTPPSFVSQAANVKAKQLAKVDLLPRIRHKVLVTPELAPIFRGKEDDLVNQFKIISRVLDGRGLMTDSGTHGRRGYRGDYLFAWIGATTPFEPKVWRVMAQLGSRLTFLTMDERSQVTVNDLVTSGEGPSYAERLRACAAVVGRFLTLLFEMHGGVRSVDWDVTADPLPIREWIARLATLLAAMRSEPVKETEDGGRIGYTPAKQEGPHRANAVLGNLARGHALAHGRTQLTEDDLPLVARVTVSSMPSDASRLFKALVDRGGEALTVSEAQVALGVKHHGTAQVALRALAARGVVEFSEPEYGPHEAQFRPEWAWCASPQFQALLAGDLSKIGGCVLPVTPDLAQRQLEEEVEELETHTPQKLTAVLGEEVC